MALDFPSSPTEGQAFSGYVFSNSAWQKAPVSTALSKNYVVNPTFQISQQNGDAGAPLAASGSFFPADQWRGAWELSTGTAYVQPWVGSVPGSGSRSVYFYSFASTTSLGANDFAILFQNIEGNRVADLAWGTASAKPAVLRFQCYAPAGTYGVSVGNNNGDESFVAPFTVAANVWTTVIVPIPARTTGTWLIDNYVGIAVYFSCASGSNWLGVAGWQSGPTKYGVTGMSNALRASTNAFHIADVGIYLDPYKTGVAPPFEAPNFAKELRRCQRYWYKQFAFRGGTYSATGVSRGGSMHPAPMRIIPGMSIVGAPRMYDGGTTGKITSLATVNNQFYAEADMITDAAFGPAGAGAAQYYISEADYIAMSARM